MKLGGFSVPLIFDISNRNLLIWANGTLAVEKPPFKPFVFKEDPRGDIYIDDYKRKNVLVRMIKFKDFVEYKNFVRKYTDYQNAGLFAIPNVKLLYYAMSPEVILNYPQTDELRVLTFDIEVETESGKVYKRGEKPIISIAAKINDDEPICFMNYDKNLKYPDTFIIRSFVDFFTKADPDIVVTYTDYDLVYLSKRMKKVGLQQHVLHRGNQPESRDIIFSIEDEDRIDIEGRLYFDVFVHVLRDQNLYGLRNRGLKEVSKFYKVATSDMIELTKDELGHTKHLIGTEKLEMYNKDDVIRTWGLFKVYFQNVINLAELLQVALNDAHKMLTKTSDIASLVMFRELARKNIFPLDTNYNRYSEHVTVNTRGKPRLSYEGAVVGMYKKPGLYAPIKKQDFSCLVSDTHIVTKERGTIKICDVKEGEHVLGIDGWHKIVKVWEFDYDGEIYDIHGVKCTPIHKFPVVKKRGKGVSHKMYDVPANELKLHKHVLTTYTSFEDHGDFVTIMDERINVTEKEKSYYKGKVYDLTLEGRPYYYANKVLVHNSFYPNTAATFNLSPETVELLEEKDYTGNYKFWREGKYLYIVIPDKNWNKDIYIRIDMSKQGILTKHFIDFFKMKQSIKKRMKEVTDKDELERLKGNYVASKVLVNSLYGNMGLVYSRFGDAIVALATTGMCRYITTRLIHNLLKDNILEIDTDGWYLVGDISTDKVNMYVKNLIENEFGLTNYLSVDEEHYDSGYFYKAKNYILKDGDKYVIHGAVFKSSSKPLIYRKVFEEAIDFIFNNPNATEKEKVKFRMKVTDMSRYEWPNDFIMSIKTSAYKEEYVVQTSMAYKLIDQYEKLTKERVRPGDTISYVVVGNREFKVLPALKDSDRPCREYYIEMLNKLMEILMLPTSNRIKLF